MRVLLCCCVFCIPLLVEIGSAFSGDTAAGSTPSSESDTPVSEASKSPNQTDDSSFVRLKRELVDLLRDYSVWGMHRQTKKYAVIADTSGEDRVHSIDWSKQTPLKTKVDQFIRSGERFRSECVEPAAQQRVLAFDGSIARVRDTHRVYNGPLSHLRSAFEDDYDPRLPHEILVDYFFTPHLAWLFGSESSQPLESRGSIFGEIQIDEEEFKGHPCWKVSWRSLRDVDGGLITNCVVYLAKDRSLLPIQQTFRTRYSRDTSETRVVETVEFQEDSSAGIWYPKQVTTSARGAANLQVMQIEYEISDRFRDESLYSKTGVLSPKHQNPTKAVIAQYAPYPVLTALPGPGTNSSAVTYAFRRKIAGSGAIGFVLVIAAVSLCLRMTRLGRLFREFICRHQTALGATGIVLTVGFGWGSSYLSGWSTYGLAMMFVGAFGMAWIVFSMLLVGDKTVSIKTALFTAACTALFFGGYSKGIKRMQVRQQMIREVRDQGGQVVMGRWHLNEDGLFLPRSLRRLLGEAWSGRANRAAIAHQSFTAENVDKWCLDELQWLGIASVDNKPFDVDSEVLSRISDFGSLWTLRVEGGYLDGEAFSEIARFRRLIDVYFDCQYRPVPEEIRKLPELERLWLTNPVVNDQLVDSLKGVETLEFVTMINPKFGTCREPRSDWQLEGVEIQHANLKPADLNTLGKLPTDLLFVDCQFNIPPKADFALQLTKTLSFRDSNVNSDSLQKFVDSPNLAWADFVNTDVSSDGIEAFSKRRPQVLLMLE